MVELLTPNYTLFIQLGLFFICYFFLKTFVFDPYVSLIETRHARTIGLKEKALEDKEKAEKFKQQYESFMKEERKKVGAWLDNERKQIADQEREVVQKARMETSNKLKTVRADVSSETERTRRELSPLVSEYSSQIASKILGRKVKVSASSTEEKKTVAAESTI